MAHLESGGQRMQFASGEELCNHVHDLTGETVILSFSGGKDSVGAYIQLRRHFKDIVPVYMYTIPNLAFVEQTLQHYEQVMGRHILRFPHPSLFRMLDYLILQPPEHCRIIEEAVLPLYNYDALFQVVREQYGISDDAYVATGVRARDNLTRWASVKMHGPMNPTRRQFYPIFDWDKDRLLREVEASGIKLGVDYQLFGRSFDGLDYRSVAIIKEELPDDYQRILAFFPLVELEVLRYTFRQEALSASTQTVH